MAGPSVDEQALIEELKDDWEQIRVCICVPSAREMDGGFVMSLATMIKYFQDSIVRKPSGVPYGKEVTLVNVGGSMLPETRHRCVAEAMKWNATHMLFVDDDMIFPPWTINQLLMRNVPVVGANYPRRCFPPIPTAYLGERGEGKGEKLYTEPGDTRLVEVKHVGTGCMMIDMRVFDYMDEKAHEQGKKNALPFFFFEIAEDGCGLIGEDVYFCEKVRSYGLPIYCDQELSQEVGHVGKITFTHKMSLDARDVARDTAEKDSAA